MTPTPKKQQKDGADTKKNQRKHLNAWRQVTKRNMRAVWNPLLERDEIYQSPVNEIIEDVVDLGQQLGFDNLNAADITEGLTFENQHLDNEDLFELGEQLKSDEESAKPTELTSEILDEIIKNFQYACDFAVENDPNEARSSTIAKNVLNDIKSYQEIAKEKLKKKSRQPSLLDFFSPN